MKWETLYATDKSGQEFNSYTSEEDNGQLLTIRAKSASKSKSKRTGRFGCSVYDSTGKRDVIGQEQPVEGGDRKRNFVKKNTQKDVDDKVEKADETRNKHKEPEEDKVKQVVGNEKKINVLKDSEKDEGKRNKRTLETRKKLELEKNEGKRNKRTQETRKKLELEKIPPNLVKLLNGLLNCFNIRQLIMLFCIPVSASASGYPVVPNRTELELDSIQMFAANLVIKYNPHPIIVNELVRLTCRNAIPLTGTYPFIWRKIESDGKMETIALNNKPKSHTSDKYTLRLSNDNTRMELDIAHFGKTDFCKYICEIGYNRTSLDLTSSLPYLSFPQQVQPKFNFKGQRLEVTLKLNDVHPLPTVTLMTEKQNISLEIRTTKKVGIFYALWMYGSTTVSDCKQNEDLKYSIEI